MDIFYRVLLKFGETGFCCRYRIIGDNVPSYPVALKTAFDELQLAPPINRCQFQEFQNRKMEVIIQVIVEGGFSMEIASFKAINIT